MTTHPPAESLRAEKGSSRAVILLVDDDVETRETVALMLEALGYQVLQAGSGAAALGVAEHVPGRIDLLLTDVRMPGMTGVELARQLSAQFPEIPVLFASGYAAGALAEREGLAPGTTLLSKPFSIDTLDSCVHEALVGAEGR
jgi:CheY-like chemotaxis protein